ncbi:unnamed protein product, partial [Brenthis ino]
MLKVIQSIMEKDMLYIEKVTEGPKLLTKLTKLTIRCGNRSGQVIPLVEREEFSAGECVPGGTAGWVSNKLDRCLGEIMNLLHTDGTNGCRGNLKGNSGRVRMT